MAFGLGFRAGCHSRIQSVARVMSESTRPVAEDWIAASVALLLESGILPRLTDVVC